MLKKTLTALAIAAATAVVQVTGCAVARDQQTVGAYVDDATINSLARQAGVDPAAVRAALTA